MTFFALQPSGIPQVPLSFYLLTLALIPVLLYLTIRYYQKASYRHFFLVLQLTQLVTLYGWYILKGFPLNEALPLYHCRMGMLAIFLLPNKTKAKQLFMLLGVGGPILALLSPDLYPYPMTHATNIAFYLAHYALMVNALTYLLIHYQPQLSSVKFNLTFLASLNLSLILVNLLTKGNYGFVMNSPLIHSHNLIFNFTAVTLVLTLLAKLVELAYQRYLMTEEVLIPIGKG